MLGRGAKLSIIMKRRKFLIALGVLPPLIFEACKGEDEFPKTPTIISGYVIDENEKPIKDFGMQFSGNTGGFNPKSTFDENTLTDEKGYYYLKYLIPEGTVSITFQATANANYSPVIYDYLCLYKGFYQKNYSLKSGEKNDLNFKIVRV
jgi:hypothetical protein